MFVVMPIQLHAQGPGFPNVPRTKGELISGLFGENGGRTATIFYQNGFIGTVYEGPASRPGSDFKARAWDISNPRSPKEYFFMGNERFQADAGVNAHGYVYEDGMVNIKGKWSINSNGVGTRVWGNVMGLRGQTFPPFEVNTWWTEYGGSANPDVRVTRGGRELCRLRTAVAAHPYIIGNILYYVSDSTNQGIASYDLSGCMNGSGGGARELSVLRQNFGGYWGAIWGGSNNKLYIANVDDDDTVIVDVTNPSNMRIVNTINNRPLALSGPMYPKMHDDFMFYYNRKVNMNTFENERIIDNRAAQIDVSQYILPLGNLLVTGGIYHNPPNRQGLAIWAHQSEPDTRAPSVGYHIPRPGQVNYPVLAPITFLIHETLLSSTTNNQSIRVRKVNADGSFGAPLTGSTPFTFDGVFTYTPNGQFDANSTYEVELVAGGLRDAAGNGIGGYKFRFSTGGSVIGGGSVVTETPIPQPSASPSVAAPVITIAPTRTSLPTVSPSPIVTIAPVITAAPTRSPSPAPVVPTQTASSGGQGGNNSIYRAINIGGSSLTVNGITFESGLNSENFITNGMVLQGSAITLSPSADASTLSMLQDFVWSAEGTTVSVSGVPNGEYVVYLYLPKFGASTITDISIEGTAVQQGLSINQATWAKAGPFSLNMTDGSLDVATSGSGTNIAGIEIWRKGTGTTPPSTTTTPIQIDNGTGAIDDTLTQLLQLIALLQQLLGDSDVSSTGSSNITSLISSFLDSSSARFRKVKGSLQSVRTARTMSVSLKSQKSELVRQLNGSKLKSDRRIAIKRTITHLKNLRKRLILLRSQIKKSKFSAGSSKKVKGQVLIRRIK
jgi:hypothetical protein